MKSLDAQDFVHLHVVTEFSLLKSSVTLEALVQKVKALGMRAIAITDIHLMIGVIKFFQICRKHQIHPIIGLKIYLREQGDYPMILLAENNQGYSNLLKLASVAHLSTIRDNRELYITLEELKQFNQGIS